MLINVPMSWSAKYADLVVARGALPSLQQERFWRPLRYFFNVRSTKTRRCIKPSVFHYTACIQKKKQGFYMVYTQFLQIFYGISGDVC